MQNRFTRWSVYGVLVLLLLVTVVFVFEFITSTVAETNKTSPVTTAPLTSESYLDQITPLLANANAENGALLIEKYGCVVCHRLGAANNIAPAFVGLAERAAVRRPPLTAAAYIFESITQPKAYVVEGYNPAMPEDYPTRLSPTELGDIIAYLLTSEAH